VGYTPREDRTGEEKTELVAGYRYGNIHERDALAAAIDAFRYYRNRLQNALRRVPPGVDLDRVRAGIIRGQSLEQVLGSMKPARAEKVEAVAEPVPGPLKDERVMVLDGTVKRLKAYVAELQEEVKARDRALDRLRERQGHLQAAWRQQLRREGEIARRDALIQDLRRRLRKEERKNRAMHRRIERMRRPPAPVEELGGVPVKVLESLTRDAVQRLEAEQGIAEGDLIFVARTAGWGRSVIRDLAERGIRALIVGTGPAQEPDPQLVAACRELPLPLLSEGKAGLRLKGKTGSADPGALADALRQWEEGQREREREEKKAMVEYIFREYRTEREKEVRKGG
jgi:predicted RNase H-like nuclease (RuvC/YqgF family)